MIYMIGFVIRKSFYDLWDNMFKIGVLNLIFLASAALTILLPTVLPDIFALRLAVRLAGALWCAVYLAIVALAVKEVSDYGTLRFAALPSYFRAALPCGIIAAVLFFLMFALLMFIIPFYLMMNSFTGLLFAALSFWVFLIIPPVFQFFFAARARLKGNLAKSIKKCFIIFFDNPLFCIGSVLLALIALVLSVFMAFLFPGPAGIILLLDEALRLRLLKYDWLEANPHIENRRGVRVPWHELLIEERENTGTRSFRSLIFPWKD